MPVTGVNFEHVPNVHARSERVKLHTYRPLLTAVACTGLLRAMSDEPDLMTPYPARLRWLRERAGLTQAQLYKRAAVGVEHSTIVSLELGRRYPSAKTLRLLAEALDGVGGYKVTPDEFPEYRLAVARGDLDERVVGLPGALENLERVVSALRQQGTPKATSSARQTQGRRKQQPIPDVAKSARGDG